MTSIILIWYTNSFEQFYKVMNLAYCIDTIAFMYIRLKLLKSIRLLSPLNTSSFNLVTLLLIRRSKVKK